MFKLEENRPININVGNVGQQDVYKGQSFSFFFFPLCSNTPENVLLELTLSLDCFSVATASNYSPFHTGFEPAETECYACVHSV